MAEKRNFLQRLLRIEPGIALGQWVWDRIVNNWSLLAAAVGGTVMSYLAAISKFLEPYGPFGTWAAAIIFALVIWLALAWARLIHAKTKLKMAEQGAIEKWKQQVNDVNPLNTEFQRQRIRLLDLAHPVSKRIEKKRFLDCELIGPVNIAFTAGIELNGCGFSGCDLVVMNSTHNVPINNVILVGDIQVIGGEFLNCTLFIPPEVIPNFQRLGAKFLSFTGDPKIDNPQQKDTEQKTQP